MIASFEEQFFETIKGFSSGREIEDALAGKNEISHALDLIRAYEDGEWEQVTALSEQYFPDTTGHQLSVIYMAAVNYADDTLHVGENAVNQYS